MRTYGVFASTGRLYAKILVRFSVLGAPSPQPGNDWGEILHGHQISSQSVQRVATVGQKPQNCPRVTEIWRYALCTMLLVITENIQDNPANTDSKGNL